MQIEGVLQNPFHVDQYVFVTGDLKKSDVRCGINSTMRSSVNNGKMYKVKSVPAHDVARLSNSYVYHVDDLTPCAQNPYKDSVKTEPETFNVSNLI